MVVGANYGKTNLMWSISTKFWIVWYITCYDPLGLLGWVFLQSLRILFYKYLDGPKIKRKSWRKNYTALASQSGWWKWCSVAFVHFLKCCVHATISEYILLEIDICKGVLKQPITISLTEHEILKGLSYYEICVYTVKRQMEQKLMVEEFWYVERCV